jgi:hypothetical protein
MPLHQRCRKDIKDPLGHFDTTCRHCDSHPPLVAPYVFCPSCGTIEMPRKQPNPRMDESVQMRMRRLQLTKVFRHLHGRYLPKAVLLTQPGRLKFVSTRSPIARAQKIAVSAN